MRHAFWGMYMHGFDGQALFKNEQTPHHYWLFSAVTCRIEVLTMSIDSWGSYWYDWYGGFLAHVKLLAIALKVVVCLSPFRKNCSWWCCVLFVDVGLVVRWCQQHAENCVTCTSWPALAEICTNQCGQPTLCRNMCSLCRNLCGLCRYLCRAWWACAEIRALTCQLELKFVLSLASFVEELTGANLKRFKWAVAVPVLILIYVKCPVHGKTWILNKAALW